MIALSNKSIRSLPKGIEGPNYDRKVLTPGIVHIGLGNFHRAHQSWYLHRLMQQGLASDWAIIGAGVRQYDHDMRAKLLDQDCLTTLIELDPGGISAEVTGSMIGYVPIEEGNWPLIQQLASPDIRIVSLTVTEGGYYIDPVTKQFDEQHADIQHDASNPEVPCTVFGAIIAALKLRRDEGIGPFTLQSCDNLQGNGTILRQTVVSLAQLSDPALASWINDNCTFPNSMVDCIVPSTGAMELSLVRDLGIGDAAPVTHENFRQWVIEDAFCAGRPDWEKVGAQFSNNVEGYESQKIRILNAGHQIIANVAEVLGIDTVSQAMKNPLISALFRKVQNEEIVPHIKAVSGITPAEYVDLVEARFSNPRIVDTIRRIAFDGSSRHTGMVIPTIRDALAADSRVSGLTLVEAAWARMCEGTREDGSEIASNDPIWAKLNSAAKAAKVSPVAWLEQSQIYGDLYNNQTFTINFSYWLNLIYSEGMEAAIKTYLKDV
ncbi:mannitol dehydrogenase family protein [Grimontia sp. NTOU-MAR1]|uniref:mannitol dehydrogenase family protein n=1 Tax=Grimontia sp. NTOU-MAR1 TaxID=3111011 RepID=UPI002DB97821|nr:mannitol dehydrogenase family protein [Grimontia sp. NTOU-MAR1]WRV99035.1 mannitol dehydrogenase family protein [Grimontia sp. NTOU-MAR1]